MAGRLESKAMEWRDPHVESARDGSDGEQGILDPSWTRRFVFCDAAWEISGSGSDNVPSEELQAMTDFVFARTTNRSILGTMNDFDRILDAAPGQSLTSAALELAEAPCGPIGMESPDRATRKLFANPDLDWGLIQFPKPEAR